MRTYGRVTDQYGNKTWVEVDTDANGYDDYVWVTTLIQCLKLAPQESPFFADYGIPAQASLTQQIFPDFYVAKLQSQFAPYFASLLISKLPTTDPQYTINIVTQQGVVVNQNVSIAQ